MAYLLLRDAAAKRTELIVIEAGVDSEGVFKPELPIELMDLLTRPFDVSESDIQVKHQVLAYILLLIHCTGFVWISARMDARI